jgi:D-3-phosphoglycerate dehydrogenase
VDDRRRRNRRHEAGQHPHQRLARHGGRDRALAEALKAGAAGRGGRRVPGRAAQQQGRVRLALRGLDNVILTPHIGGSTLEAQANIGLEVAEKLVRYSDNGTTTSSVNFPEVALPAHRASTAAARAPQRRACCPRSTASFRQPDQHRRPVPADQRGHRLRGDRHRCRIVRTGAAKLQQVPHTLRCRVLF